VVVLASITRRLAGVYQHGTRRRGASGSGAKQHRPPILYGYARVSTVDQDHSTQGAALKAAGCEVIRAEKASGTPATGGPSCKY
jgi:hypothetical protein